MKREEIVEKLVENFNGKIVADTSFLTIVDIGSCKITINKNGEMILRDINSSDAEILSGKLMKFFDV
ncbi:MAG: hypothetical protein QXY45_03315 [Candidatus Aenigmatarchaeota archaeon]